MKYDGRHLPDIHRKVWNTVQRIPRGRVCTYGRVALMCGMPRRARLVGHILHNTPPGVSIPWHRVVNAGGRVSLPGAAGRFQRTLLEQEAVQFNGGRIDLEKYLWVGNLNRKTL